MENLLQLKTIDDLTDMTFFVPAYQRGYRWGESQVIDLLNDINEFNSKEVQGSNEKTWYCLQPLVTKKREGQDGYEVIDGQQRLTTIYLILYYLNQRFTEENREKLFSISYATRPSFEELEENGFTYNDHNIDFHHITQSYEYIKYWFENNVKDKNSFQSKIRYSTKVIWYESSEEDPISIFTRINIGKIPLTNAELIKALFLNSSNFDKDNFDQIRLKQLEISNEWDRVEKELQNDRFWYFLTGNDKKSNDKKNNRIEFIFNLMNDKPDLIDDYSTFRFFSNRFKKNNQEELETNWLKVKSYFQRFEEWFSDRELYHKIGFLLNEGVDIKNIIEQSKGETKSKFKGFLHEEIKKIFSNIDIENLKYGDKKVKSILLLYNIQTMLNNEKDNSMFPFDLYKKDHWDIEHITSVTDNPPDKKDQAQWLEDTKKFIEKKDLLKAINDFGDANEFEELFKEIVQYFNEEIQDTDIDDLANLTLLDSTTNRGYKNAVFPVKRKTIIEREKSGTFIPLCTKNVFLKYFSDYPPKISFWTQDDREKYLEDIEKVLEPYLKNTTGG